MAASDYNATAASNTAIATIDITGATGKVKDGDNAIRQIMADVKAGVITGYTTTATAAGTTTLTVASNSYQYFTGSTTQTIVMPVTSALELGRTFVFVNNSTGALTINSSGGNLIVTVDAGASVSVQCILLSGTTAASWALINGVSNGFGGTVSLPGLHPTGDTNTGFYPIGVDNVGFAANGAKVLDIATTGLTVTGTLNATTTAAGIISSLISTEAGATAGPTLDLYRNSGTPADSDLIGRIEFNANLAASKIAAAWIRGSINDTAGPNGALALGVYSISGGTTNATYLSFNGASDAVSLSKGQIKFPATQNPSSDANTLDDYEEGPWSPTITSSSGTITTVTVARAVYVKVGTTVNCWLNFTVTTNGTGAGLIRITTPFTMANTFDVYGAFNLGVSNTLNGISAVNTSTVAMQKYDGTYPATSGSQFVGGFTFQAAN